jgi:pimeloyl-ACP methyl ester carboxylesterase
MAGDQVAYSLFIPQPGESLAAPPYPAVVISHGFARSKRFHANTACALAERGIVVLTPDLISLLGGEEAQLRNIDNLVDHVHWLRTRVATEGDPLFDLLDPERIGLVGHSAGGAISFEAAIELAEADECVDALMLLDGVPWARTVDRASELPELAFASVRSEPSACNAEGAIREVLTRLPFMTEDILVVGGSHCDPESPSDLLCRITCGGSSEQARAAYQELVGAFLGDAFAAPDTETSHGFAATVDALVAAGRVATSSVSERSQASSPVSRHAQQPTPAARSRAESDQPDSSLR